MFSLRDSVAIVTGAGQGIGREIALSLARNGAKVVIIDVSDKIFEVLKEIEKLEHEGLAVRCDVSNVNEVEKAVKEVLNNLGG